MYWHPNGNYLAVKVERRAKKKYNFEIFRMREKDIPIEQVEIKEDVISFAWEPQGTKFSIISSSETNSKTNNIIFYDMNEKIVKHLSTYN